MKKIFASVLAVIMMATLSVAASAADFNAASALNNAVVVDGEKDLAYVSAAIPVNFEAAAGAATGDIYAAWDNDYLYLYIEVKDAAVEPADAVTGIWSDDCAEFYINLSGEEGAITDINAAQYTFGPSFTAFAGGGLHRDNNMDACKSAYKYTDAGWNVEVALAWGDEYAPAEGEAFPFCAAINDESDGDGSTREAQTFTGAGQSAAWQTADANWDTLNLTAEEYVEPVVETEAEVVEEVAAPQTFDAAVIAAVAAVVSAAGYALSKKR